MSCSSKRSLLMNRASTGMFVTTTETRQISYICLLIFAKFYLLGIDILDE